MKNLKESRESLHEKTSHGKKTFPYIVYHARIPEWLLCFPLHWHDEFELILVTYGQGIFTVNGRKYLCEKDDIILIPSGAIHSMEQHQNDNVEYFNILFSFSLLEENPDSHCSRQFFSRISENVILKEYHLKKDTFLNSQILPLVKDLVAHRAEKYSGYELMIKARLFEILHIIINQNLNEDRNKNHNERERINTDRLKKILSYTAEHFSERITIEDAASVCSVSPSRFMSIFRAQTGMSYIQYLNDYRLEASTELLTSGSFSVTEIAIKNGFENISYFIRAFRKKFGCTPLEYRSTAKSKIN